MAYCGTTLVGRWFVEYHSVYTAVLSNACLLIIVIYVCVLALVINTFGLLSVRVYHHIISPAAKVLVDTSVHHLRSAHLLAISLIDITQRCSWHALSVASVFHRKQVDSFHACDQVFRGCQSG